MSKMLKRGHRVIISMRSIPHQPGWFGKLPVSDTVLRSALTATWYLIPVLLAGCATPQYTIRQTPVPDESAAAIQIERRISAYQAKDFEQHDARPIGVDERLQGFAVQALVDRLSRVTERPALHYHAYLYRDRDPNAAALADGRIYLSTGLFHYLASRGSRPDELAFVVSHELAHTVAQHLVKRYQYLQRQQLLMALLAAGASVATKNASVGAQEAGRLALDVASMLRDVANSGYSQEQELEADQLRIRYCIHAGFDPRAALDLLKDFTRFDNPWPFLRTHPYITLRRTYLERYLADNGLLSGPAAQPMTQRGGSEQGQRLRAVQKLYPVGSVSWKNLQRQIDALERSR